MAVKHTETEVRFLEINQERLKSRLEELNAIDKGEKLLKEVIFNDKSGDWNHIHQKLIRLRSNGETTELTFKQHAQEKSHEAKEINLNIDNWDNAIAFIEEVGFVIQRYQEKRRHSFELDAVSIDIDSWPHTPTYVELEGNSEGDLKKLAEKLELNWDHVELLDAKRVLEQRYNHPISNLKYFTFDKMEEHSKEKA